MVRINLDPSPGRRKGLTHKEIAQRALAKERERETKMAPKAPDDRELDWQPLNNLRGGMRITISPKNHSLYFSRSVMGALGLSYERRGIKARKAETSDGWLLYISVAEDQNNRDLTVTFTDAGTGCSCSKKLCEEFEVKEKLRLVAKPFKDGVLVKVPYPEGE